MLTSMNNQSLVFKTIASELFELYMPILVEIILWHNDKFAKQLKVSFYIKL